MRAKLYGSLSGLEATNLKLYGSLSGLDVLNLKLDWTGPASLTPTTSSLELLLLTDTKEAVRLTCLLITCNRSKTLSMGIKFWSSLRASTTLC